MERKRQPAIYNSGAVTKRAKPIFPGQKGWKTIPAGIKLEAHALAVELIAQLQTDSAVKKALRANYGLTISQATAMARYAAKAILRQHGTQALPEARSEMLARLEALYRAAFEQQKLAVCATVLGQIAALSGLAEKVVAVQHTVKAEFGEGRGPEELEYYAQTGHWPADGVVVRDETGRNSSSEPEPMPIIDVTGQDVTNTPGASPLDLLRKRKNER